MAFTLKLNGKIKCSCQTKESVIEKIETFLETHTLEEFYSMNKELIDDSGKEYVVFSTDLERIDIKLKINWK